MRTLTDWQPYASLIMAGIKKNETRNHSTGIRGEIAIHAAVKKTQLFSLIKVNEDNVFNNTLDHAAKVILKALPSVDILNGYTLNHLPRGMVLGTVEIVDCLKIVENNPSEKTALLENGQQINGDEYLFGDYDAGRYAWVLKNPKPFETPILAKGKQGWWKWEKPEKEYIKKLSQENTNRLLNSSKNDSEYTPHGLFYTIDNNETIVGIDNSTGDAFTEEFCNINACFDWLTRKAEKSL